MESVTYDKARNSVNDSLSDGKYDAEKAEGAVVDADNIHIAEFDDPNIDKDHLILEDDSPYPEVRSAVGNTDDPEMPCNTIRAWVLGLIFAIVISGLNQFFFFRYPSVTISNLVAQLLSLPFGRLWAIIIPNWKIFGAPLNPGPFTIKEHVLITIMASVGAQSAYATDIIAVQRVYFNQQYNFIYRWLLVISTQIIGFSIGGVARRFLVQPPSMIWPQNLVYSALFNTLHSQKLEGAGNRGGLSRERFFVYIFIFATFWYTLPGYLFTALGYFSWVCWIAPNNIKVNQLFGYGSGLGMSVLTFDWSQITYVVSPLATPWWAAANVLAGFVFFFWFLSPILYYTNAFYAQYLPISSRTSYDRFGQSYNVTRILTPELTFDEKAFKEYSPLYLSTTFALNYGLSFASILAVWTHTFIYFRKQIWTQARRSMNDQADIHARLMSRYPQVPEWWYMTLFVVMFVFGIITIEVWHTDFPVWGFILSLIIPLLFIVPIGMIQAITNQQIGLNVITEFIAGYAIPGRPIAVMMFKTWGYISMYQALQFLSDFKLGHYMKVPPRAMFWGQVVASLFAGTTQLGVQAWLFSNIKDICSPTQPQNFICPNTEVFGTAAFIWGVIGPKLQFSTGQVYHPLLYFFLIGAGLPVLSYLISRQWNHPMFRYFNFPVMLAGIGYIPPATALNYAPWALICFIFNYVIRRRHFSWWTKYNYVLSAALDSGTAIGIVLVFFCLQYPKNSTVGANNVALWWGNTVYQNTVDWKGASLKAIPSDGFGLPPGSW